RPHEIPLLCTNCKCQHGHDARTLFRTIGALPLGSRSRPGIRTGHSRPESSVDDKIRVLFMQSQRYFGADSMIHGLSMRYLDRRRLQVYVACSGGSPQSRSPAFKALERIPDLALRPVNFGPTLNAIPTTEVAKSVLV